MDIANLLHMANRIGTFFEAMPDHDEAVDGVALHLRRYWEPRMRALLESHFRAHGADGMHPLVAAAVPRLSGYPAT